MKATKCYKTSDGEIHMDKAQARRRQAELDLFKEMDVGMIDAATDADSFARHVLPCREQFMELFRAEDALKQKPA